MRKQVTSMLIRNKFDNECGECGEIAWTGEQVYYNSQAPGGKKIRHERCGDFDSHKKPKDTQTPKKGHTHKTKVCKRCNESKSYSAFASRANAPDGKQSWCQKCSTEYHRERKADQPPVQEVAAVAPVKDTETIKAELAERYDPSKTLWVGEIMHVTGLDKATVGGMTVKQVAEYLELKSKMDALKKGAAV